MSFVVEQNNEALKKNYETHPSGFVPFPLVNTL